MKSFIASHLRDMNRKTVYELIAEVGEISRAEISKITGISAPTVLKITNYLCDNDFIFNAGEGQSALGRKPQLLRLNPNFVYSIGVDYEGDCLKLGIVNINSEIIIKKIIQVENDFEHVITNDLVTYVQELIIESGVPKSKIIGLGIGFPGVVNPVNDEIKLGPLVGVFNRYPLHNIIEKIQTVLDIPVHICNDVNAAAIGEYKKRRLKNEDLVYISLGTGLGSGIILDGDLYFGRQFTAGEIGYMVYESDYQIYENKPGLLESLINLNALSNKFKDFEKRIKGKYDLDEIIEYIASYLGRTIVNIVSVLDVNHIVLGGLIMDMLSEDLVAAVSKQVAKLCFINVHIDSRKCEEPGIIGATYLITRQYLDNIFNSDD